MSWKIGKTETITTIVLLCALGLPVATVLAAYTAAHRLALSNNVVQRSQQILLLNTDAELKLLEAGGALREYQSGGGIAAADRSRQLAAAAYQDLAQLRQFTNSSPGQKPLVDAMQAAMDRHSAELDRQRSAVQAGHAPGASLPAQASGWQSERDLAQASASVAAETNKEANAWRERTRGFSRTWTHWFYASLLASLALLISCFFVLVREIRQRRRTEAALAQSHALLEESAESTQQLIENIPSVVWTIAQDGASRYISSRMQAITGFTPQEVVQAGGDFWSRQLNADDAAAWKAALGELFQDGTPLAVDLELRTPSGAGVWLQARGTRVYDRDGQRFADGVFIDITERRRQESLEREKLELELRTREAERASHVKSEFIANVSHELRTPLTSILGFSDLMLKEVGGTLNGQHGRFVAHIHEDGEYLLRLINDILDLSRIEGGQARLTLEPVDFSQLAAEAISSLQGTAQRLEVYLSQALAPGLIVSADATRLRQILNNLVSNALKFTPEQGSVRVTAEADGEFARVRVADTGIGIAADDQVRVFEKFHQVGENPRGKSDGTGLGLAITKQLVEMQGGTISVESEPGKGSCFTFTLRLASVAAMPPAASRFLRAESA